MPLKRQPSRWGARPPVASTGRTKKSTPPSVRWAVVSLLVLAVGASLMALPSAQAAESTRLRLQGGGDATIRNGPPARGSGYAIGNALAARPGRKGVAFDQVGPGRRGFRYGKFHGNVRFCAWLSTNAPVVRVGRVPMPHCPGGTAGRVLPPSKFMHKLPNGKLLRNCEPGTCSDGSRARVRPARCARQFPGGVPVYGNVLPWRSKAKPHDRYATIRAKSYLVLWRYVSRDGNWVMVRDPHKRDGAARRKAGFDTRASDWFFVPRSCVFDHEGKLH